MTEEPAQDSGAHAHEEEPPAADAPMTEDELRAAMEEQLRRVRVEDVVLQSVATLVSLAGRRLGVAPGTEPERDLEQARVAIEGVRALVPLVPPAEAAPIREALTQLQLAYAREARSGAPAGGGEAQGADAEEDRKAPPQGEQMPPPASRGAGAEEAERARARARIWTPPGS